MDRAFKVGTAPVSAVRRAPVQARTQRKVVRILEATAELLERMPVGEITTTHIARAAHITTGTVYRFFPHREAIFESLLLAYFEKFRAIYDETLTRSQARNGAEITNEVIDVQVRLMLSVPGFRVLWASQEISPHFMRRLTGSQGTIPALAKRFLPKQLGVKVTKEIERRMALTTVISNSVLAYAFQQSDEERDALIAELKRILTFVVFGPKEPPLGASSQSAPGGKGPGAKTRRKYRG